MNTRLLMFTAVLALAIGNAVPAFAKANGHNLGPDVFDYTESGSLYPKTTAASPSQPCYAEPSGSHSQIRWESSCARERRETLSNVAPNQAGRYVAPQGFHRQIRWD